MLPGNPKKRKLFYLEFQVFQGSSVLVSLICCALSIFNTYIKLAIKKLNKLILETNFAPPRCF